MNFAHLASFQAIEFMDSPVPKMLHIIVCTVCQTSENKAVETQHSVVCEEREHNLISSPVSMLSARSA